jgi:hypothetical protein
MSEDPSLKYPSPGKPSILVEGISFYLKKYLEIPYVGRRLYTDV